jgi:hypothetical protein
MESTREFAKALIKEMERTKEDCLPGAAETYRRLSVIDYADYLKRSSERTPEANKRVLETAYLFAEKAIALGVSEERIERSFGLLRMYWIPRLAKEKDHAPKD